MLMYFLKDQQTALHLATKGNYSELIKLLLNSNADPNICDKVSIYCLYKLLHITRFKSIFNGHRMLWVWLLEISILTLLLKIYVSKGLANIVSGRCQ